MVVVAMVVRADGIGDAPVGKIKAGEGLTRVREKIAKQTPGEQGSCHSCDRCNEKQVNQKQKMPPARIETSRFGARACNN